MGPQRRGHRTFSDKELVKILSVFHSTLHGKAGYRFPHPRNTGYNMGKLH